jgi:hypothetical protein
VGYLPKGVGRIGIRESALVALPPLFSGAPRAVTAASLLAQGAILPSSLLECAVRSMDLQAGARAIA